MKHWFVLLIPIIFLAGCAYSPPRSNAEGAARLRNAGYALQYFNQGFYPNTQGGGLHWPITCRTFGNRTICQ